MPRPDIPVFVWESNPAHGPSEVCELTACFVTLGNGVHVTYTIRPHEGVEELHAIGTPVHCDGSCVGHVGQMVDFGEMPNNLGYVTRSLFEAAMNFHYPFRHKNK